MESTISSKHPLILFCASKWVMLSVVSPSMAKIMSPMHRLAWAALLPGVTYDTGEVTDKYFALCEFGLYSFNVFHKYRGKGHVYNNQFLFFKINTTYEWTNQLNMWKTPLETTENILSYPDLHSTAVLFNCDLQGLLHTFHYLQYTQAKVFSVSSGWALPRGQTHFWR